KKMVTRLTNPLVKIGLVLKKHFNNLAVPMGWEVWSIGNEFLHLKMKRTRLDCLKELGKPINKCPFRLFHMNWMSSILKPSKDMNMKWLDLVMTLSQLTGSLTLNCS